ncbi:MAG: hypothetical protein MJ252_29445 [archaeon]|nr:hypothetical protein [archaeon]
MKSFLKVFFISLLSLSLCQIKILEDNSQKNDDLPTLIVTKLNYPSNCNQVGIWPLEFNMTYELIGNYSGKIDEFEMQFVDMIDYTIYAWCNGTVDASRTLQCITMREIEYAGEYIPLTMGDIVTKNYRIKEFMLFNSTVGISITESYVRPKLYGQNISTTIEIKDDIFENLIFEFESDLDEYSLAHLKTGTYTTQSCAGFRKNLLYCPIEKSSFPPRDKPYNISLENVCGMEDIYINLTVKGTPLVNVTSAKFEKSCSKLRAGTQFDLIFNTTGELPLQDTIIDSVKLQYSTDEIPCSCVFNKDHFKCGTTKNASTKSEGGQFHARMDSDYWNQNYSIMPFLIQSPTIKYSESCPE